MCTIFTILVFGVVLLWLLPVIVMVIIPGLLLLALLVAGWFLGVQFFVGLGIIMLCFLALHYCFGRPSGNLFGDVDPPADEINGARRP